MRPRNIINAFAAFIFVTAVATAMTANPAGAQTVSHPSSASVSPNLSDLPIDHFRQSPAELHIVPPAKPLPQRSPGPGGPQGHIQGEPGSHNGIEPKTSFGGVGANGFIPPDPNIAVGKNDPVTGVGYIVQLVNSQFAVFDKTGKLVTGPVSLSSLWSSLPGGGGCATNNAGDPVVQYDAAADRWLVTQLGSTSGPTYSECIAVSQNNNPSGPYYLYSYSFDNNLNDYPKFGVWPTATNSAYLASYNLFTNGQTAAGAALCAYNRTALLAGDRINAVSICKQVSDQGFLPADLDGATPPPDGTPGYFVNFASLSSLSIYTLAPNFADPTNSTLTLAPGIAVAPFNMACDGGTCIVQPNGQKLDSLGDRLMYRLAYRVFPDHTSMVVNHSITVPGPTVGVRWYELRQSATQSNQCDSLLGFSATGFYLCQQGTFAPDASYRWMGSAAMDGAGNIAIGYSKSSGNIYPSIVFAARTPSMAPDAMGAETTLQAGAGAQTTYSRWGDYTSLRIDPSDDTTFWYTNEYYTKNSRLFNYMWATAISSFTVGASSNPPDFSLSTSSNSLTVRRGASGSTTVTVGAINGSSSVNLSVSGLPQRTSASFDTNPVTSTGTSTLTISANRNAPTGPYNLTVTGNNGSASHTSQLQLTIQ
jgi:hypothetical protein